MKINGISLLILGLMAFAFASNTLPSTGPLTSVYKSINNLCYSLVTLLPVASMLMVVVAGVIYAAGQIMGAETRARANVWATAALTGALIGVLIYAVAPSVLKTIYGTGQEVSCGTVV